MQREAFTMNSAALGREMPVIAYGNAGYPIIVFPTQDSPCTNWEDFGLIDTLAPQIDAGEIQLFCVDSVDKESWSDTDGDKTHRAEVQEAFYRYVCDEVVPLVHERTHDERRPLAMGCSMGATHSVIFALRRPDLFEGCIAMSGVYDAHYFFGDWMNETLYLNSPTDFLPGMPADHSLIPTYNRRQLVLCMGQGAWEEEGIRTQRILQGEFERLGVNAWCDFWGFDVNHDWPWWKKQVVYFLPIVLANIKVEEREAVNEEPALDMASETEETKPVAKRKRTTKAKDTAVSADAEEKPKPAKKPAAAKKATASKKPAATKKPAAKKATSTSSTKTKTATKAKTTAAEKPARTTVSRAKTTKAAAAKPAAKAKATSKSKAQKEA